MNRAIDAYLTELEARRYSYSVTVQQLRDFAVYVATRHRSPTGQKISAAKSDHSSEWPANDHGIRRHGQPPLCKVSSQIDSTHCEQTEVDMKVSQLVLIVALTIASPHGMTGFAQSPRVATQDLLSMPIDNLELEAANIHLLLSELSTQKRVPIGLEISPDDDLSQTKTIRLKIKHGTLADALKSIVEQNPVYTWKLKDNVVNVLPIEANRDPLLRDVLEVKLEKFSIPQGTSRFTLRQTLSTTTEIRGLVTQQDVLPEIQTFMSRDFLPLGRRYRLQAFDVTVAGLLNQVIRESQTKYWIILRNGDRKQYFVLNL